MEIDRRDLLTALQIVKPGLAYNDIIEQSTSFCFLEGSVITYNDDISIRCPLKEEPLTGAIDAVGLYDFLHKVNSEKVTFEEDSSEIIIKAGRSKAGFVLESEIVLPVKEIGNIKKWKSIPADFCEAISFCASACSKNNNTPVLTCIHVKGDLIEGADNHRIANYTLSESLKINPFLLPAETVPHIAKFEPIKIAEGNNWVHFLNKEKAIMSCRLVEGTYVPTQKHLVVNEEEIELKFPSSLAEVIERARIFTKSPNVLSETVEIKLENNKLLVSSNSESGWFQEKLKIKHEGKTVEFLITPYLLQGILKEKNTAQLSKSKLIFHGEKWIYLTMLKVI